ncbi:NUDIX domain-containing protein [Lachnospiraceae bacterium 29-91]
MEVKFYSLSDETRVPCRDMNYGRPFSCQTVEEQVLKFAVIISRADGKWVFCKHKDRNTYEVPGGHREENESILETAKRELYEETGAIEYDLRPVCVYSVIGRTRVNPTGEETFGMLYYAEIRKFEQELHSEIEKVELFEELPEAWTYPDIQPLLIREYLRREARY